MAGLLDLPADIAPTTPDTGQFAGLLADPNNQLALGLLAAGGPTTDPNASGFGARLQSAVLYAQKQKAAQALQVQQQLALARSKMEMSLAAQQMQAFGGGGGGGGPGQGVAPQPGAIPLNGGPGQGPNSAPSMPTGGPGAGVAPSPGDPGASGAVASPVASGGPGAGVAPVVSPAPTVAPAGSPGTGLNIRALLGGQIAANTLGGRDNTAAMSAFLPKYTDVGGGNMVDTNPLSNPGFQGGQQTIITPGQRGYAGSQVNPDRSISLPAGALESAAAQADTFNRSKAGLTMSKQPIQVGGKLVYPSELQAMQQAQAALASGGGAAPPSGGPGAAVAPPAPQPSSPGGAPGLVGTYTNAAGENLGQVGQTNPAPVGKFALLPNGQVDVNRAQAAIDAMPGLNVPPMAVASARAALAQQIGAQKPLIGPGAGAPPAAAAAPTSSGNPQLDALVARQAQLSAQADGSAGPSLGVKQEMEANAAAIEALQKAQATSTVNPNVDQAKATFKQITDQAATASQARDAALHLLALSAQKSALSVGPLGSSKYATWVNPSAAEYQKSQATLQKFLQGTGGGGSTTDASNATSGLTVPDYGLPQDAQQAGLKAIIANIDRSTMKAQALTPVFNNNIGNFTTANQQFDQHVTPAAVPAIQALNAMPAGPQKKQAALAMQKTNPQAFDYFVSSGLLK